VNFFFEITFQIDTLSSLHRPVLQGCILWRKLHGDEHFEYMLDWEDKNKLRFSSTELQNPSRLRGKPDAGCLLFQTLIDF